MHLVAYQSMSGMAMVVASGVLGVVCLLYIAAKPQAALLSQAGKEKPVNVVSPD